MRKVAQSRAAALVKQAKSRIERDSLDFQNKLLAGALTTVAARALLDSLPAVESLMPPLNLAEFKLLGNVGNSPEEGIDNVTTSQPARGTSRSYILERLKRERPDLFERVKAKEISANRAAILAGWRKKSTPLEHSVRYGGRLAKANALLFWRRFAVLL